MVVDIGHRQCKQIKDGEQCKPLTMGGWFMKCNMWLNSSSLLMMLLQKERLFCLVL